MSLNRSQSGHHLSHLPLAEANIVVTEQRLQRDVRGYYRLKSEGADEQELKAQRSRVRASEIILKRLREANARNSD